jgi:hypothetical protein
MISPLLTLNLLAVISTRLRSSAGIFTDIGIILDMADPTNKGKKLESWSWVLCIEFSANLWELGLARFGKIDFSIYSSRDMERIVVRDLEGLKRVLEDPLMSRIYEYFIPHGAKLLSTEFLLYPHEHGCKVHELNGRFWIYVRIRYAVGDNESYYDAALWKILKRLDMGTLAKLLKHIEIENE